jgi:hypothetical protein
VVAVHRHCLWTSQLCRPLLGLSESLTVPILEPQDNFSLLPKPGPKGLEEGCCTCNDCTYPLKPGVVVACMGLSTNLFCLNGLAWGHRGGLCTRMTLHRSTLSFGVWQGGGVARVFRAQSAAQVSVLSLEKITKNVETHAHCKTMFQKQGQADLKPFRHHEEYILCRIQYRIRYHILYIV